MLFKTGQGEYSVETHNALLADRGVVTTGVLTSRALVEKFFNMWK
jgi:hypothetical protein